MSRTRSARTELFASGEPWTELRDRLYACIPSTEALRRLIPVLVGTFLLLAGVGIAIQLSQGKEATLASARDRLALMADLAALTLQTELPQAQDNWQSALAASLPQGATFDGRMALLADTDGKIKARAPIQRGAAEDLLDILGPQQPLTTLGADAGVLPLRLADGTEAIVTVRDVPNTEAQITFLQPVDDALAGLRWMQRIEITLLVGSGLLLLLLGGAVYHLGDSPGTAREHADGLADELREVLPGCGVWRWNLARGHVHWSAPMYRMLGLQADSEPMGFHAIAKLLHPLDDLRGMAEVHLRENRSLFDEAIRLRHAGGNFVRLRLRGHIARDADTNEPYLTAIAAPSEVELPSSFDTDDNQRLRDAVESISEAFVLWDNQNRLVMCNSKYQQFHGLQNHDVRPGTPYEAVIAASAEPLVRKRIDVAEDDSSRTYEAQLDDGRWLHINERRTKDGGYVSVGTDVTALKENQERLAESELQLESEGTELKLSRRELEQQKQQLVDLAEKYALEKNRAEAANRAKSEFLANISHELRTPLNAVIGFSEVMQQSLFGPLGHAKYQEYARDIHDSGTYLLEVINDILDMSKIEAGRMTLDIDHVDVAEIVADSMKVVSRAASDRGIALERHGPSRLMIEADRRALKQIFLNLLSNAVKFTREDGNVDVHLSRSKGNIKIAIKDTGIGIPEADIVKLGRPFEQVENQFSKSHQGSGLGLAISRALIELHGGDLRIASREGQGTTVTCTLPVKAVSLEEDDEPRAAIA
jgi:two-component system, cell cycle sensor histidine kinase PleC